MTAKVHWLDTAPVKITERLWGNLSPPDSKGCMVWIKSKNTGGYGMVKINNKVRPSHVIALEAFLNRPLGDGLKSLHHCDNPPCCNPLHLYEGTQAQNMRDAWDRGRMSHVGEKNSRSILTVADVKSIRDAYAKGGVTQASLAVKYLTARSTINAVITGQNWRTI